MRINCKINIPEAVRRGFNVEDKMEVDADVTSLSFKERDVLSSHLLAQNFKNPVTHLWPSIPEPTAKGLQETLAQMVAGHQDWQRDSVNELEKFKAEFDAKLAAMSDEELKQSFAALGVDVEIRRPPLPMEGIQKQCWDAMGADKSAFEESDQAFIAAVSEAVDEDEEEDDNECSSCGEPNDDGEGYDGLCGHCADRQVRLMSERGMRKGGTGAQD